MSVWNCSRRCFLLLDLQSMLFEAYKKYIIIILKKKMDLEYFRIIYVIEIFILGIIYLF